MVDMLKKNTMFEK
jgi:calcium-dependent protein kinase